MTRAEKEGFDRAVDADPLMVYSVEKAFRVLNAFDRPHRSFSLSQLAMATGLDKSATQRFVHTLVRLGYLAKDPATKHFSLTVKTLDLGARYLRASSVVDRAMPYLLQLSRETEETVNLTVLDGTDIVFVARFLSRHILNADVVVGTRLPAFCTAPGRAMLAELPRTEAMATLQRTARNVLTPKTLIRLDALEAKLDEARVKGYATAWEEVLVGDLSVAAAVRGFEGRPIAAINVATSRARFAPEAAEARFAHLVTAAAATVSQLSGP